MVYFGLHFNNREEVLLEYEHNYREYEPGYCLKCDIIKTPRKYNRLESTFK
jgi:hypothetical protein